MLMGGFVAHLVVTPTRRHSWDSHQSLDFFPTSLLQLLGSPPVGIISLLENVLVVCNYNFVGK